MNLSSNTVLVTGGASGIGLALATRFHRAGNTVAICGRREDKLREARERLPGLLTRVCDLSQAAERRALAAWVTGDVPGVNVLVNNAGVQYYPRISEGEGNWELAQHEISINFEAPVHLAALLIPHLLKQEGGAIVNITSGLAFAPLARAPIYSATKAALHSFTLSLRHQVSQLPLQVIEIAPPAVDTDLGAPGLHTWGVNVDEFVDAVMPRLAAGELEIGYGFSDETRRASRHELDAVFQRINQRS